MPSASAPAIVTHSGEAAFVMAANIGGRQRLATPSMDDARPHFFASSFAAAAWKSRRTSLASLFGKFERWTIRT
jgi:hypothetical protein